MNIARIFSASFFPSNSYLRQLLSFGGSSDDSGRIFPDSFFSSDSLIRRLRSLDSSNDPNQTTAESNHQSPRYAENPIRRAMEMEAGSPTGADPEQNSKRLRKLVPTVLLALAALCFGIYASIPPEVQLHPHSPLLNNFLIAFVSLGAFTSVGLLLCFVVRPEVAEVTRLQKFGTVFAITFFSIAFVLRIALLLPVASFGYVWLVFFLVTAVIAFLLYVAIARGPDYRLPISVPPADGGAN